MEYIEYKDFERELAEVETWNTDDKDAGYQLIKTDDNYFGIGWELRGSRGQFEGLREEDMMYWRRELYPQRPVEVPAVIPRKGKGALPVRIQLKDVEEGVKLKNQKGKKKVAARPKLGQARRGALAGEQPGPWGFWTQPEDRHLRDWVLSSQGDAFGAV